MSEASAVAETPSQSTSAMRRGRWVVISIFLFAIALTATMWVYWRLHIGPFLPLQKKLADKWPDSRPQVQGGQRKIHKETPKILRVTMYIAFDPTTKDGQPKAKEYSEEVAAFVRENEPSLSDYDVLEIRMLFEKREQEIKKAAINFDVSKLTQ